MAVITDGTRRYVIFGLMKTNIDRGHQPKFTYPDEDKLVHQGNSGLESFPHCVRDYTKQSQRDQ
jgi:hypothetical protein